LPSGRWPPVCPCFAIVCPESERLDLARLVHVFRYVFLTIWSVLLRIKSPYRDAVHTPKCR
jgi:hypothetical protein